MKKLTPTHSDLSTSLDAFARDLAKADASLPIASLTDAERKVVRDRARRVPVELVAKVAALAAPTGSVLGIAFDAARANEVVAYAAQVKAIHARALAIVQRLDDDLASQLEAIGTTAFAIYLAMGSVQRTPEGRKLIAAHKEMRALLPRRSAKKQATASEPASPSAAASSTPPPAAAADASAKAA